MQRRGLKINILKEEGAAFHAGLKEGDVMLDYNGCPLDSANALASAMDTADGPATVGYLRNGLIHGAVVKPGALGISYGEVEVEIDHLDQVVADMIVSTAQAIDGYKATKQLGVVTAECVFGLNLFKDFFTSITDVFGGRSKTAQSALRDAREKCLAELKREAAERGANAIIAVDLDYSEFSGQGKSMLFLVASGTAVFVEIA